MGFHAEFREFRELRIFENFKNNSFSSGQGVVQIKTKLGIEYNQCYESVKQKKIGRACLRKKLGSHTEFCESREWRISSNFKNSAFS